MKSKIIEIGVSLTSYKLPHRGSDLLNSTKVRCICPDGMSDRDAGERHPYRYVKRATVT